MLLSHHDNSVSVLPVLPAVRGASEKISDSVARIQCHQEVDPKVELGVACSQSNSHLGTGPAISASSWCSAKQLF